MNPLDDRLAGLRDLCPGVIFLSDGGRDFIFLPSLKITTNGKVMVMDALLLPGEHSGYLSRLFLSQPLPSKGRGGSWTALTIAGRNWHTWSWQNVPATLPLPQMLLEHLWALR